MIQYEAVMSKHKHTKHLPKNSVAEAIGWIGAAAILVDYALLSFGILSSESILYHVIFMVGCIGLAIVTYRHRAFQSVTVNTTFTILAFIAIIRLVLFA